MKKSRKKIATISAVAVTAVASTAVGLVLTLGKKDNKNKIITFKQEKIKAINDMTNYLNSKKLSQVILGHSIETSSAVQEWNQMTSIIKSRIESATNLPNLEFEKECLKATIDARLSRYNNFAEKVNLKSDRSIAYDDLDEFWLTLEKISKNFTIKTQILAAMQDLKLAIARTESAEEIKEMVSDFKNWILNDLFGNLKKLNDDAKQECILAKFEIKSYWLHLQNKLEKLNKEDEEANHVPKVLTDLFNYVNHDAMMLLELVDKNLSFSEYEKEITELKSNIKEKISVRAETSNSMIKMYNSRKLAEDRSKEINEKIHELISDISNIKGASKELDSFIEKIEYDSTNLMNSLTETDSIMDINDIIASKDAANLKSDVRNFVYLYSQTAPKEAHILHTKLDLILFILISKNPYIVPIEDYAENFSVTSQEIVKIFKAGETWFEKDNSFGDLSEASLRTKMLIDEVYDRFGNVVKEINDEESLFEYKYSSSNEIISLIPKYEIGMVQMAPGVNVSKNSIAPDFDDLLEALSILINENSKIMLTADQINEVIKIRDEVLNQIKTRTTAWIEQHKHDVEMQLISSKLQAKYDLTVYFRSLPITPLKEGAINFMKENDYKNYLSVLQVSLKEVDNGQTVSDVESLEKQQEAILKAANDKYNNDVLLANAEKLRKEKYDVNVDLINKVNIPSFDPDKRYKNLYNEIISTRNEGLNTILEAFREGKTATEMSDLTTQIINKIKAAINDYRKYILQELVIVPGSGISNGKYGYFFQNSLGDLFAISTGSLMIKKANSNVWEKAKGSNLRSSDKVSMIEDQDGNVYTMGGGSSSLQVLKKGTDTFVDVEYEGQSSIKSGEGGSFAMTQEGDLYAFGNASAFVLKKGESKFKDIKANGLDISPGKGVKTFVTKDDALVVFHDKIYIKRKGTDDFDEIHNQSWYDGSYPDLIQVEDDQDGNLFVFNITFEKFNNSINNGIWKLEEGAGAFVKILVSQNSQLYSGQTMFVSSKGDIYITGKKLWVKKHGEDTFSEVKGSADWWDPDDMGVMGGIINEDPNGGIYILKELTGVYYKKPNEDEFNKVSEIDNIDPPSLIYTTSTGDIYLVGTDAYVKNAQSDTFVKIKPKDGIYEFYESVLFEDKKTHILYWMVNGHPLFMMVDMKTAQMYFAN